ncbi:serine/threonine-protein kinase [Streptomyces sp. NPDC018031]|uniref:serine/threonine-protein kinase n=1 Tax=Streptomyces sp. NPDC018031 TaxID=3365033 RepID=UPI00378DAE98
MEDLGAEDPRWIGQYRLLRRLGAGGMGRVFLAHSARGRTVAVKLVQSELAQQAEFRRRFKQEVKAAQRVGGEWTAPVLDADTEAATPWVATGYIAGPSLHEVIAQGGRPLPERSVRILGNGLTRALEDIHRAGLVHRDLKPSNVLITIDGPRVIDFGIARALETVTDGILTRSGAVVGSPGFMSPEQVRGERVTPASDVFCLGSVLAFAGTGRQPFGTSDSGVHAVMYRIAQEEPDLRGLPEGLLGLVQDCLRKAPEERPTLEQLLERTAGAEDEEPGEPWLPGSLVAQLGRHAVELLEAESPAGPVGGPGVPAPPSVRPMAGGTVPLPPTVPPTASTPPAGPATPPPPSTGPATPPPGTGPATPPPPVAPPVPTSFPLAGPQTPPAPAAPAPLPAAPPAPAAAPAAAPPSAPATPPAAAAAPAVPGPGAGNAPGTPGTPPRTPVTEPAAARQSAPPEKPAPPGRSDPRAAAAAPAPERAAGPAAPPARTPAGDPRGHAAEPPGTPPGSGPPAQAAPAAPAATPTAPTPASAPAPTPPSAPAPAARQAPAGETAPVPAVGPAAFGPPRITSFDAPDPTPPGGAPLPRGGHTPPGGSPPPDGGGPGTPGGRKPRRGRRMLVVAAAAVATLLVAGAATFVLTRGDGDKKDDTAKGPDSKTSSRPADRSADPTPSRSGSSSPSQNATAPVTTGDVPDGYLGAWQGEIVQDGYDSGKIMRIVLTQGTIGSPVAESLTSSGDAFCQTQSTLKTVDGLLVVDDGSEVSTSVPADACSSVGEQTLNLRDGSIIWTDSDGSMEATLRKAESGNEAIPAAYLGTWQATDAFGVDNATYQVTIEQGAFGTPVATTLWKSDRTKCEGTMRLVSVDGGLVLSTEEITRSVPADKCSAVGSYTFTADGENKLRIEYDAEDSDEPQPMTFTRLR